MSGNASEQAPLWFFENLDHINRAIQDTVVQGSTSPEDMLSVVLDTVLAIFQCDRAWLVYPCDPEAPKWSVPMERTRPDFSGALDLGLTLPLDQELVQGFRAVRQSAAPVRFGPGGDEPLAAQFAQQFGVQSQMAMAIYPKIEQPYMFGLHQCSQPRVWSANEVRLFQEIGRRLADALTTVLAHRAVRDSERKLADAQQIAHVGYWERDIITERVTASDETYRIVGLQPGERDFTPASARKLIHPDDLQMTVHVISSALMAGQEYDTEFRILRADGEVRFVQSHGSVRRDESGRPRSVFGTVQDITDRRRAQDQLRASEARFRTFVDHATDALYVHDASGLILDVNRHACESLGYAREELIGQPPTLFDCDATDTVLTTLYARLDGGETLTFESRHRRKDGLSFPVEVRVRPFWQDGRRFAVSLSRDITERKRAEQALIESHSLLRAVIEGTSDAVFVKDLNGRYLLINSAGARVIGRTVDEVIGHDDRDLFTPETAAMIMDRDRQVIAAGTSQMFEEAATAAGVTRIYLATKGVYRDAQGHVAGVFGISHDITEAKRLEEQFRQSQKMEAVGRLAGGVAHDFNNLLTVINGCSELALDNLGPHDPTRELLDDIRKAGERAATLTRQLLAFSRKQVLLPQVVNLNTLLSELHKLLKRLIGEDVDLSLVLDPELGLARVDPGQFEQAIINLVVNARDAMPNGGRMTIHNQNAELDEHYARHRPEMKPGSYVLVAVRDSGTGMDEATKARIFEPFFTTKESGKGTGLGLAMVYGFVKQSGGHIEVTSQPGLGTTFTIYLPRAYDTTPSLPATSGLTVPKGSETVLLVEDEAAVRGLSKIVLQANGYTVLEAEDGHEALQIARQHRDPIHLLVTDVVMPRVNGRRLADLLLQTRPDLRILFMSGYTDEAEIRQGALEPGVAFLQKPFSPMTLARKVREVLDTPRDRQP